MERPTRISRPYMPGYGTLPANEGTGLLPWSWAEERLVASRNYWLVSVWPDGGPPALPVGGVGHDPALSVRRRETTRSGSAAASPRAKPGTLARTLVASSLPRTL